MGLSFVLVNKTMENYQICEAFLRTCFDELILKVCMQYGVIQNIWKEEISFPNWYIIGLF